MLAEALGSLPSSLVRRMPTIWADVFKSSNLQNRVDLGSAAFLLLDTEDADDLGRSLEILLLQKSRGDAALF